jgi:hypothetical protein
MTNTFYVDGHKVEQQDRFNDGSCWFEMMLLPGRDLCAGPFTPVEFARHRAWGINPKWADRNAIHVPMQDTTDNYNGGYWPVKQCEPQEVFAAYAKSGRQYRACTFSYAA